VNRENAGTPPAGEPVRVRAVRLALQHWPFPRGREATWRILHRLLPSLPFLTEIEPGIFVVADLDDYIVRYYFLFGLRKDPSFRLGRDLVRPGDTVIDVGANIGLWVMGVARAAGPTARIHAFEPLPANFERLEANVGRNSLDWIQCHPLALAERDGEARLLLPRSGNSGVGSLRTDPGGESVAVTLTTLDGFCRREGLARVHFLKVDVEGAEMRVFEGAGKLLASDRPPLLMFEVGDSLAAAFGTSSAAVKARLATHGYGCYRYRNARLQTVDVDEKHTASEDLIALHPCHLTEYPILAHLARPRVSR
jgi:FkbM family methyltransferase